MLSNHKSAEEVEGLKKHVCRVCGAKFFQKCHLDQHMLSHNTPQYMCHICNKALSRPSTLRDHLWKKHGVRSDPASEAVTSLNDASNKPIAAPSHAHDKCHRVGYIKHDEHFDFLLDCGTFWCGDEERSLEDPLFNFPCAHEHCHHDPVPHCPQTGCSAEASLCEHITSAPRVKHGDHYDFLMDGHLWNLEGNHFVNHGPLPLEKFDEAVEGFIELISGNRQDSQES